MSKKLQLLVIHCTDTPAGRNVSKADIEQWHIKENGWSRVGYSDMIHLDGCIENLHPYDQDDEVDTWEITNGVKGFNGIARHVVYVGGGYNCDTRTQNQKYALEVYVKFMLLKYPQLKVCGHYKLSTTKQCPSFNVTKWLQEIGIQKQNIY